MKSSIKVAVVAFFAIGISAYAQDSFIRPELSYVKIANNLSFSHADDTKSPRGTIGYGIAGGAIVATATERLAVVAPEVFSLKVDAAAVGLLLMMV